MLTKHRCVTHDISTTEVSLDPSYYSDDDVGAAVGSVVSTAVSSGALASSISTAAFYTGISLPVTPISATAETVAGSDDNRGDYSYAYDRAAASNAMFDDDGQVLDADDSRFSRRRLLEDLGGGTDTGGGVGTGGDPSPAPTATFMPTISPPDARKLALQDSYGDGWNGAYYTLTAGGGSGETILKSTLSSSSNRADYAYTTDLSEKVQLGECYQFRVGSGSYDGEISWSIGDKDGTCTECADGDDGCEVECTAFHDCCTDDARDDGGAGHCSNGNNDCTSSDLYFIFIDPVTMLTSLGGCPTAPPSISISPTVTPAPSVPPTFRPTFSPTGSRDNLFGIDLANADLSPIYTTVKECEVYKIGDGNCDSVNNHMGCGFDGGDCCSYTRTLQEGELPYCEDTDENGGGGQTPAPTVMGTSSPTVPAVCQERADYNCKDAVGPEWPFFLSIEQARFGRYPFSLYTGMYQTIEAQKNTYLAHEEHIDGERMTVVEDMDGTMIPSMACPDCDAYDGPYQSMSFDTSVTSENMNPMFPGLETTRERFFLPPNQVVAGPMLTQRRIKGDTCVQLPSWEILKTYYNDGEGASGCLALIESMGEADVATSKESFGYDPTFLQTSSLYRATNEEIITKLYTYYNITDGDSMQIDGAFDKNRYKRVTSDEVDTASGVPYGFFYDQGTGDSGVTDYPIIFDINLNVSRASEFLTFMRDGSYLDGYTHMVSMEMLLFNPEMGIFV